MHTSKRIQQCQAIGGIVPFFVCVSEKAPHRIYASLPCPMSLSGFSRYEARGDSVRSCLIFASDEMYQKPGQTGRAHRFNRSSSSSTTVVETHMNHSKILRRQLTNHTVGHCINYLFAEVPVHQPHTHTESLLTPERPTKQEARDTAKRYIPKHILCVWCVCVDRRFVAILRMHFFV